MNKFDDCRPDITKLLRLIDERDIYDPSTHSGSDMSLKRLLITKIKLIGYLLTVKTGIYERLLYASIVLGWFREFCDYWVGELGNRPLQSPHVFHYLGGVYRQKFQEVSVPDNASDDDHLRAWQDHRNVHLLFANTYKLAKSPLMGLRFLKYIRKGGMVCEYGCGAAPVTTNLSRFYPELNLRIDCADIPTITSHYTKWKFLNKPFIRSIQIDPSNDDPLPDNYDVIFLLTVLEHLQRPLSVARNIIKRLKPGGYLIFDYIASEGKGLDTRAGVDYRIEVLTYLAQNLQIVKGKSHLNGRSVGTVVGRRL